LKTSGNGNVKLNKDTLEAIMQASDWFFEQVGDDLGAYAQHAGRKTIDENDVVTLMKR
jgi:histone H3/H4